MKTKWWWDWQSWLIAALLAWLAWELSLFLGVHPNECIGQQGNARAAYYDCPRHLILFYPLNWVGRFARLNDSAFVALSGLAVALFTFTLWRSTEKLWAAGERQYRLSQDTARRQLRAYMSIRKVEVTEFSVGHPLKVELVLVNTGQTPARHVKAIPKTVGGEATETPRFKAGTFKETDASVVDLGAGEPFTLAVNGKAPLDEEIRKGLIDKKMFIVVGCLVRYSDVFGHRHRLIVRGTLAFNESGQAFINAANKNNRGD